MHGKKGETIIILIQYQIIVMDDQHLPERNGFGVGISNYYKTDKGRFQIIVADDQHLPECNGNDRGEHHVRGR